MAVVWRKTFTLLPSLLFRSMVPPTAGLAILFALQQAMAPLVRVVFADLGSRRALLLFPYGPFRVGWWV